MDRNDDDRLHGRLNGDQPAVDGKDSLLMRMLYMILRKRNAMGTILHRLESKSMQKFEKIFSERAA